MTKTGMKAPQGTGMVVASADIQNCRQEVVQTRWRCTWLQEAPSSTRAAYFAYQVINVQLSLRVPQG